jgi:hypothetical protein
MFGNRPLVESAVDTWANTSLEYIAQTFGEGSAHLNTFLGQIRMRVGGYAEPEAARELQERNRGA